MWENAFFSYTFGSSGTITLICDLYLEERDGRKGVEAIFHPSNVNRTEWFVNVIHHVLDQRWPFYLTHSLFSQTLELLNSIFIECDDHDSHFLGSMLLGVDYKALLALRGDLRKNFSLCVRGWVFEGGCMCRCVIHPNQVISPTNSFRKPKPWESAKNDRKP